MKQKFYSYLPFSSLVDSFEQNDFTICCSGFKVSLFPKYSDQKKMHERCENLQWNGSEIFLAAKKSLLIYWEKKSAIKIY